MLIKNTHVVPARAPSTAEDGRVYRRSRIESEGESTLFNRRLHLSAEIRFDLPSLKSQHRNIPFPGSYDSVIPGKLARN